MGQRQTIIILRFCPLPKFGKQLVFSNWIDSMQKMIMQGFKCKSKVKFPFHNDGFEFQLHPFSTAESKQLHCIFKAYCAFVIHLNICCVSAVYIAQLIIQHLEYKYTCNSAPQLGGICMHWFKVFAYIFILNCYMQIKNLLKLFQIEYPQQSIV